MKDLLVVLFVLISLSLSAQVHTFDTDWLFRRGNTWEDSVSIRTTAANGAVTYQVASDTLQDTLTSNVYNDHEADIGNMWVSGAVWNDSAATGAPDTVRSILEMGLGHETGGYPDSTGILWKHLITVTQDTTYRISVTDSTWFKMFAPGKVYLRWRETTAQRNKYSTALHTKRGK